jgi:hypothetical protein
VVDFLLEDCTIVPPTSWLRLALFSSTTSFSVAQKLTSASCKYDQLHIEPPICRNQKAMPHAVSCNGAAMSRLSESQSELLRHECPIWVTGGGAT